MSHQTQLANAKYRNWVKAALGLKYVKEGLEPFCDDIVKQQHEDILNKVKQKRNLATVNCGLCDLRTLQPDHVRTKNKNCPLGQVNCNCQYPSGKVACPNGVCGAIYDEIVNLHASRPPAPYWRNSDSHAWCTEPWSIAKCFINASGYKKKLKASDIDCCGLLHIFINNKGLQQHLHCKITGNDVFSQVRQYRNLIFHSDSMEMEDGDVTNYINDMIDLLKDGKELASKPESQVAIHKLLQLKCDDFIISSSDEAQVKAAVTSLKELEKTIHDELEQLGSDVKQDLEQKGFGIKKDVAQTVSAFRSGMKHTRSAILKEMEIKSSEVKTDIEQTGLEIKKDVVDIGLEIKKDVLYTGSSILMQVEKKGSELKKEYVWKESKGVGKLSRSDYNKRKKEFQKKLVNMYKDHVIRVSALPLLPERNQTLINDVYVPPLMTKENANISEFEPSKTISMHEIIKKEGKSAKNVYVLGGAGSGKSVFCKSLVSHWCMAHSKDEGSTSKFEAAENRRRSKFEIILGKLRKSTDRYLQHSDTGFPFSETVKEIQKFEFLFYLSLRHCSDYSSIQMMLENTYSDAILREVLEKDSSKCLVLLDGLDEWTPPTLAVSQFQTKGLPERDISKKYTVITTSRPWKFYSLLVKDSEVDKCITLKGIDKYSMRHLAEKTINILNEMFHKRKSVEDFLNDVKNNSISDIIHIPMILQQLVCLWFDERLHGSSKSTVYSSMLDLFFEWSARKVSKKQENKVENLVFGDTPDLELPQHLRHYTACCDNKHVIYFLSRLAYETLFDQNKERTLAFTSSKLCQLKISNYVKTCSLKFGILSEDRCVSLDASRRQSSSYSFVHKSIQEYLAAVFIAMQFDKKCKSVAREDYSKKCVLKYLRSCRTVNDILEQSNVFVMLCGIEPQLTSYITEYIYGTATADKRVMDFMLTHTSDDERFVLDIQKCIISCLHEVISMEKQYEVLIHMGDIFISYKRSPGDILFCLDRQVILLDSKGSMDIRVSKEWLNENAVGYLTNKKQLKAIRYGGYSNTKTKTDEKISELIVSSASTLECLVLYELSGKVMRPFVQNLPRMNKLVALQVKDQQLSHDVCESLSTSLVESTQLQQIAVYVNCSHSDQHVVNFSRQKQLQSVMLDCGDFYVTKLNATNLAVCKLHTNTTVGMKQVAKSLYGARKLKELELCVEERDKDNDTEPETATEILATLLASLTSLSALSLDGYALTDNVITHPSDMVDLKQIRLKRITMSMTTWCRFIDSLPALPQIVKVKTSELNITKDTDSYPLERVEMAHQYVREKTNFFRIKWDIWDFHFTTVKVDIS